MNPGVVISKRLVLVNSLSGVAAKALNLGILLWLYRYLLARISTEEFALYPVLAAAMVFLPLVSTVLTGGLGRYIVEAYAKGEQHKVVQIVSTMFVLLLGAGLAILAMGLVFVWNVHHVLTVPLHRLWDARIMMALMVCSFVIRTVLAPFQVGLYVRQKFVLSNLIALCQQLLRIAFLFVLLFGVSTRVLWVVVASVSANICGILVMVAISRRLIPALKFRTSCIHWPVAKEVTSFGGWNFIAHLADTIRRSADPLILNKFGTAMDVTCFHLGSLPYNQIRQFSSVAQRPLMPPLTAMHATGSKDRLRNAYLRGGRYGLWATLFLSVPLIIYSQEIIRLYVGEKYGVAAIVISLLLVPYSVVYGHVMLPNFSIATGRMRPLALRVGAMQLINLLLTLYLVGVRRMGAVGSALSTCLVTTFAWPVLAWPLGLRMAGLSFSRWLRETLLPGLLPALPAAAVLGALKFVVRPSSWLGLGGCVACGLLCYAVVLLVFCLRPADQKDLQKVLGRAWSFASFRCIFRRLK